MAAVPICSDFGAQGNKVLCCDPTSNLVFSCILGKKKRDFLFQRKSKHHTYTHSQRNETKPKALSEISKNSCQTQLDEFTVNESETQGLDFPFKVPRGKREGKNFREQLAVPAQFRQLSKG